MCLPLLSLSTSLDLSTHTHTHVIDYLVQGDIFHLLLRVLDKVEEINVAGIQEEEQLALTPWNRLNNTARCKTKKGSTEFSECVCARIHLCVNERCLKRTKKSEHWIQRHVQKIKEKKKASKRTSKLTGHIPRTMSSRTTTSPPSVAL